MELIKKAAQVSELSITPEELNLINKYTIKALTADEVFVFKVAICDNEIDRDFEVFPKESLTKFAELFEGKTMISDHQWKSGNQCARIYKTEVVEGIGTTKDGETYSQLVAHCYMLKNDANANLIADINAGIKKEVSVGLRIGKAVCSICGVDNRKAYCEHWNGREYEGKLCYFRLKEPKDAYEVSFVAVPAQPKAGIIKAYGQKEVEEPGINTENPNEPDETEVPNESSKGEDLDIKIFEAFVFIENIKSMEVEDNE